MFHRNRGDINGVEIGRLAISTLTKKSQLLKRFSTQFAYGHREILLNYAGLDHSTIFTGILQHGMTQDLEISSAITPRLLNGRRSPFWVFNINDERRFRENGYKNVKAIGAPWIYLESSPIPDKVESEGNVLIFPTHRSISVEPLIDRDEIRSKILFWLNQYGENGITICLVWSEFVTNDWQVACKELGVGCVTAGVGMTTPTYSPHPARIDFLRNLRQLIVSHKICVFETYTSAIFYALSLGKPCSLIIETQTGLEKQNAVIGGESWLKNNFPSINRMICPSGKYQEESQILLGYDVKKSRNELRSILRYEKNIL